MIEELLDIEELKTYFYTEGGVVKAVDGVNLGINKKEAVGLVGESGCGKTTLAFSVMRLVPIPGRVVGGQIKFNRRDLLKLGEEEMRRIRGRRISMIFQDPMTYLNPVMKVGDQVAETILLHQGGKKSEVKEKVIKALEKVGIYSPRRIAEFYPHNLSGGMKQRILVAMALSCNPALLIADEPTTALDMTVQAQILDLIREIKKTVDTSLLLITHDLGIVAETCDKVYIMYAGKIIEHGDVYAIFEKPKHPYTAGLLKAVLSIDEFKETLVVLKGTVPDLTDPPSGCRFHPRCPSVKAICREREPPSFEVEPGHFVSCWLYS